jgi:pimeloyl-ACP methyl ester carboxylesterase
MAHGTSATITMVIDCYAEALYRSGFAVLLYDHRNFGISGGTPRQQINPWIQMRGYRDAISFVETLPDLDSTRIAIWGCSYSGGQVIAVGALDARVQAVIAQTPACGEEPPPPDADGSSFAAIQQTFQSGNVSSPLDEDIEPVPVVSSDQLGTPSLLKPISAYRWFIEYGGRHGTNWVNWATRVVPNSQALYHPVLCAPFSKTPILFIIAREDEMPSANPNVSRLAYELAPEPKELLEIEGGHFGLLHYPSELFEQASSVQSEFLLRYL